MKIGRVRVNITDGYSDRDVSLMGEYVRCERVSDCEYDVVVKNDRFRDVRICEDIPLYKPVFYEKKNGMSSNGKQTFERKLRRFKMVTNNEH